VMTPLPKRTWKWC